MVTNAKKVTGMEEVQGPILVELCKLCMVGHQELEISRTLRPKVAELLGRLHIDVEGQLPVTFFGFRYLLFIKDAA